MLEGRMCGCKVKGHICRVGSLLPVLHRFWELSSVHHSATLLTCQSFLTYLANKGIFPTEAEVSQVEYLVQGNTANKRSARITSPHCPHQWLSNWDPYGSEIGNSVPWCWSGGTKAQLLYTPTNFNPRPCACICFDIGVGRYTSFDKSSLLLTQHLSCIHF